MHPALAHLRSFRVVRRLFSDTSALRCGTDSLIPSGEECFTWDVFLWPRGPSSGQSRRQSLCSGCLAFTLHSPLLIHILHIEAWYLLAENCGFKSQLSRNQVTLLLSNSVFSSVGLASLHLFCRVLTRLERGDGCLGVGTAWHAAVSVLWSSLLMWVHGAHG